MCIKCETFISRRQINIGRKPRERIEIDGIKCFVCIKVNNSSHPNASLMQACTYVCIYIRAYQNYKKGNKIIFKLVTHTNGRN